MIQESAPLPTMLGVYGVCYSYSRHRPVLTDLSLELERGELLAVLGPNGSGKSTLLKLMSGIISLRAAHGSGVIRFRGQEIQKLGPDERARGVAYIGPDLRSEFPVTAFEAVLMGRICQGARLFQKASARDGDAVHAAMERAQCWGLRDRELHTLSGGERQLVALARALAQGARVLLLDEALSRMDLNHQAVIGKLLIRLVKEENFSVVLVSHDLNLATEWADKILFLRAGERLAYGHAKETMTEEVLRRLYPGTQFTLGKNPNTGMPKVFPA